MGLACGMQQYRDASDTEGNARVHRTEARTWEGRFLMYRLAEGMLSAAGIPPARPR